MVDWETAPFSHLLGAYWYLPRNGPRYLQGITLVHAFSSAHPPSSETLYSEPGSLNTGRCVTSWRPSGWWTQLGWEGQIPGPQDGSSLPRMQDTCEVVLQLLPCGYWADTHGEEDFQVPVMWEQS